MNNELLQIYKKRINNALREFFNATDIDELEYYKFELFLRIDYLFTLKYFKIMDKLKERKDIK